MERGKEGGRERRMEQGREQGREGEGGGEAEKPEKEGSDGERLVGGDEGKQGCCQAAARRSRADEVQKGCSPAVEEGRTRPRRS